MSDRLQPLRWPPLVGADGVPVWIQIRDALLTVGAWGVLLWLAQDMWLHLLDMITPPFFVTTFSATPDWVQILSDLRPFLILSELLLVFLLLTAVGRRHHLQRQGLETPPPPLMWAEHLSASVADVADGDSARPQIWHAGVVTVSFNPRGQAISVQAKGVPTPSLPHAPSPTLTVPPATTRLPDPSAPPSGP